MQKHQIQPDANMLQIISDHGHNCPVNLPAIVMWVDSHSRSLHAKTKRATSLITFVYFK